MKKNCSKYILDVNYEPSNFGQPSLWDTLYWR